jgi:hypothetical protein
LYPGIDYQFRPESYWVAARNPLEAALRKVKGRNRREMIRDYHEAGNLDQLGESLLADTLDEQGRKNLGLIHPTFMGGEYLPNYGRSEVEIARIELESTTNDVISLRARPLGSRIKSGSSTNTRPNSVYRSGRRPTRADGLCRRNVWTSPCQCVR